MRRGLCPVSMTFVEGISLVLLAAACNQNAESVGEAPGLGNDKGAITVTDTGPNGEGHSPTPVTVSWVLATPELRAQAIGAVVTNKTDSVRHVELQLVAVAPTGQVAAKKLGAYDIPAKDALTFNYAAADLPVQSVGLSSSIALVASYEHAVPGMNGPGTSRILQVQTPALHVTFESAGGTFGVFRTGAQEADTNASMGDVRARLSSLRIYDIGSNRLVDATREATASDSGISVIAARRPGGLQGPPGRKQLDRTAGGDP